MKEVLLAIGIKFGGCVLDCLGRKKWQEHKRAKQEAAELAEQQRQKQADLEQRVKDACEATVDCENYLPIREFKPRKGKTKHGKKTKSGTGPIE